MKASKTSINTSVVYESIFRRYQGESAIRSSKLLKDEPAYYKKALKLIGELYEHPRTGTGKPKQLTGDRAGQWRRKISDKHRLIYEIHDQVVEVVVISAWGHYGDK